MAINRITGKYPGCCGRLNFEPVIISYRAGHMSKSSNQFPPPPKSLCTDPAFIFGFKWASWMLLYVGSPSSLVRKGIRNYYLMSVAFSMFLVLGAHFLWWSLLVCIDDVWKGK